MGDGAETQSDRVRIYGESSEGDRAGLAGVPGPHDRDLGAGERGDVGPVRDSAGEEDQAAPEGARREERAEEAGVHREEAREDAASPRAHGCEAGCGGREEGGGGC